MTEDQNDRLDIKDPRDRRIEPVDEVAVDTDSGDEHGGGQDVGGDAKEAPESEDLSDFLDEVAGKQIIDMKKEIQKLRLMVEQRESAAPKADRAPANPAPTRVDDKVGKRQSQFVSRTSQRDGTAMSPTERATRSVEELMRKRGIL